MKILDAKITISSLAWSHSKLLLAILTTNNQIQIWDIEKDLEIFKQEQIAREIYWSKDDSALYIQKEKYFISLDLEKGEGIDLNFRMSEYKFSFFNNDKLAIGFVSNQVVLYEKMDSGYEVKTRLETEEKILTYAINEKKKIIAIAEFGQDVQIYDYNLKKAIDPFTSHTLFNEYATLQWDLEGNSLYIGDFYGNLIQYNINTQKILFQTIVYDEMKYDDVGYDEDKAVIYFEGKGFFCDKLSDFGDPSDAELTKAAIENNSGETPLAIEFNPLGGYYAISQSWDKLMIFSYPQNKLLKEIKDFPDCFMKLSWSSNGEYLAGMLQDDSLYLWNLRDLI